MHVSHVIHLTYTLPIADLHTIVMEEPYFEDQIYAELGYSFQTSINGGQPTSFIRDRQDDTPRLGFFLESFPTRDEKAFINGPIIGGQSRLPKETTYKPISSLHYEKLQSDNFWDHAVRKWGMDMVQPQNLVTSVEDPDKPGIDKFTKRYRRFRTPFHDDLNQALDSKNKEIQKAISLNKEEREAYSIAEQLASADKARRQRARFWKTRSDTADDIVGAKNELEDAWQADDKSGVVPAQRRLGPHMG